MEVFMGRCAAAVPAAASRAKSLNCIFFNGKEEGGFQEKLDRNLGSLRRDWHSYFIPAYSV
jgi:hypothetical protein